MAQASVVLTTRVAWKYRYLAVVAIALAARLDSYRAAFDVLRKEGAKESDIKNAKQLTTIYGDFVARGPATSDWFDRLDFKTALLVNRASNKLGPWCIRKEAIFDGSATAHRRLLELAASQRWEKR